MKKIFIAFSGEDTKQSEKILKIKYGYEFWNLKKFEFNDFVKTIQKTIPPVNKNVLGNYTSEGLKRKNSFGISKEDFNNCSWGILIADSLEDIYVDNYTEAMFIMNLYSPEFIRPYFYVSSFGILSEYTKKISYTNIEHRFFKVSEFVSFFRIMMIQSQYGSWQLNRAKLWDKEDWRLFVASFLYKGLEKYEKQKDIFGWQRESADMCSVLEALFTAGDNKNEEINYRLTKRIASLLAHREATIEPDIKRLYSQRSSFVHGSFFEQIARDSKSSTNNLPIPDFEFLYKQKEYIRLSLVAYLRLSKELKSNPSYFDNARTVIETLEKSIIDIKLRKKIHKIIDLTLDLLPKVNISQL